MLSKNYHPIAVLKRLAFICLLVICTNASAQETVPLSQKINAWESVHAKIEKSIKSDAALGDNTANGYRQNLRQIRLDAANEAGILKEKLNSQKDLLAAIGQAPDGNTQEDKTISEKRKKLDADVTETDAEFKQINLIVAKSDELLLLLENYQAQKAKAKLLAKTENPLAVSALESLYGELKEGVGNFSEWWQQGAIIILIMLVVGLLAFYATCYVNSLARQSANIVLSRPFSPKRLLLLSVSAYWVFILRFGVINLEGFPVLENIIHIIASSSLSLILFMALGKFRFVPPESKKKDSDEKQDSYSWLWNSMKGLVRIVLLLLPVAAVLGYINLAQYVSFNIMATLLAALLFFLLRHGVEALNRKLHGPQEKEELSPFAITIVEPIFAGISVLVALFFWGMTSEDVKTLIAKYRSGILVGEVTVDFVGILSAIGLFFAVYYFTKLLQWFLSSRVFPYTELDVGVKDAIVSISGYVGMVVALLTSIGALGFDMSKLAIVAGALSVGIGFGLQAIFNNFVSGLILLFERPVRVGDWIIVGDKQGVVKKIQVRSTEIETFHNSSVIIPNSQLISETITNWTLHDKMGRVDIAVGVAYGSDTDKVKEVLLEVAEAHPEVRKSPEPKVFFMNFGESSLDFELRCFIRNIRDVFSISSDLRFAIDMAFRKNHIQIPFPQRDVHMKK